MFDALVQDITAGRLTLDATKAGARIISLVRTDTNEYVYDLMPEVKLKRSRASSVADNDFRERSSSPTC
jgi:hypothetical protein